MLAPVHRLGERRLGWRIGAAHWPLVIGLAAILTLAVHARRPTYLLTHPFWLDEAWVADSVRAPLSRLGLVTSSTPIGWTLLLRAVPPWGGPERYRLLPLAFSVAGVVPAWLLGRQLRGPAGWVAAPLAGLAAAVGPAALRSPTLKQFSADAFVTLLLLWALTWVERAWAPWRLSAFGLLAALCFLVADAAMPVSAAAFLGLALSSLARRAWARLAWVALIATAASAVQYAVYLAFVAHADSAAMRAYWAHSFIPTAKGLDGAASFVGWRSARALAFLGLGAWPIALALGLAGVIALVWARLPAAALLTPLLFAELVVAGLAGRYPFLDFRTSEFFLVLVTVLAAIGAAAVASWLARSRWTVVLGLALVLGPGSAFLPAAARASRRPIPDENVRGQVALVRAARSSGDAVVVSSGAAHAFGYYWPERPSFVDIPALRTISFQIDYPDQPDVVVATGRDRSSDLAALSRVPAGARRIWIVVGHERLETWTRLARRRGRLVTPPSDPCRPFPPAALARAGVSPGQCPLLLMPRPAAEPGGGPHLARGGTSASPAVGARPRR